jgi:hypothetical protein
MRLDVSGLVAFSRFIVENRMDASTKKIYERHLADRPAKVNTAVIVDYLKSAQWSFSRLIGNPVAQSLSLFLSPYPPTFYELAEVNDGEVRQLFSEACTNTKDNKLDKRKIPGAAAIMMLDPTCENSVGYIAKPLRELFKSFHDEDSELDDHTRFKKLCQTITNISKELFTEDELNVTFARLPVIYSRRKHLWKTYDPAPAKVDEDSIAFVPSLVPCPLLTSLYAKKLAAKSHGH